MWCVWYKSPCLSGYYRNDNLLYALPWYRRLVFMITPITFTFLWEIQSWNVNSDCWQLVHKWSPLCFVEDQFECRKRREKKKKEKKRDDWNTHADAPSLFYSSDFLTKACSCCDHTGSFREKCQTRLRIFFSPNTLACALVCVCIVRRSYWGVYAWMYTFYVRPICFQDPRHYSAPDANLNIPIVCVCVRACVCVGGKVMLGQHAWPEVWASPQLTQCLTESLLI